MSRYKIELRKAPGWQDFKIATLGVSISSPNWQDGRFAAILDFAATHFKAIRIHVTDALYRHNFMAEGLSAKTALEQANALGALWLTRHQDIISSCAISPRITRWGEWYNHPDYANTLVAFQLAHEVNSDFREAVGNDVMGFFSRKQRTPSLGEIEHGKNYLIEEVTVACLQARGEPSLKIYPGEDLQCMRVVRLGQIPEAPAGLEHERFAKLQLHEIR